MKIGILGTGVVGRTHAVKLTSLGYDVVIGTSNIEKTMANKDVDRMGNLPFIDWQKDHKSIRLMSFTSTAKHGEIIYNALNGMAAIAVLKGLKELINDKILIDITNPLDFSKGMPPVLFVCNSDSLGEQIQKVLPKARVVKTLNTVNALIQVNPKCLANGDHHIFVSGNDNLAKAKVIEILKSYGWENTIDLGDINTARGTEMLMPIWLRLWGVLGTANFNYKIVKE